MLSLAFCDDDSHYIKSICTKVRQELKSTNTSFDIYTFTSGEELIQHYKKNGSCFDIVFLDIDMVPLDGLQTAGLLRQLAPEVLLVFLTSMADKVYDAFGYNAFKFIRKDYSLDIFLQHFRECTKQIQLLQKGFVFSTTDGMIRLTEQDILFFEIISRKFYVQTTNMKYRLVVDKFEEISTLIEHHPFFEMPNRSTLINMRYIKNITKQNFIILESQGVTYTIELSRYKKYDFYDAFIRHIK